MFVFREAHRGRWPSAPAVVPKDAKAIRKCCFICQKKSRRNSQKISSFLLPWQTQDSPMMSQTVELGRADK